MNVNPEQPCVIRNREMRSLRVEIFEHLDMERHRIPLFSLPLSLPC